MQGIIFIPHSFSLKLSELQAAGLPLSSRAQAHSQLTWASDADGTRPDPAPALPGDGAVSPLSAPGCGPGLSARHGRCRCSPAARVPGTSALSKGQSWVLAERGWVGAEQGLLLGDTSMSCKG